MVQGSEHPTRKRGPERRRRGGGSGRRRGAGRGASLGGSGSGWPGRRSTEANKVTTRQHIYFYMNYECQELTAELS